MMNKTVMQGNVVKEFAGCVNEACISNVASREIIVNKTKVTVTSIFNRDTPLTEKLFIIADRKLKSA